MGEKIAVVALIISNPHSVERVNSILHDYSQYVIGRLGIPYREKGVSVISIVLDCEQEKINSLSGKLGMIDGVSSKVLITK